MKYIEICGLYGIRICTNNMYVNNESYDKLGLTLVFWIFDFFSDFHPTGPISAAKRWSFASILEFHRSKKWSSDQISLKNTMTHTWIVLMILIMINDILYMICIWYIIYLIYYDMIDISISRVGWNDVSMSQLSGAVAFPRSSLRASEFVPESVEDLLYRKGEKGGQGVGRFRRELEEVPQEQRRPGPGTGRADCVTLFWWIAVWNSTWRTP